MRMRHTVICGLSGTIIIFHIISYTARFSKKNFIEQKMSVLIYSTKFVRNISYSKKNCMKYDHECVLVFTWSTRCSCPIVMKLEFFQKILGKYSDIEFRKNPSTDSRVVPCGRTDGRTYGQTDLTKLTVAFRNFTIAPKNSCYLRCSLLSSSISINKCLQMENILLLT